MDMAGGGIEMTPCSNVSAHAGDVAAPVSKNIAIAVGVMFGMSFGLPSLELVGIL